MNAGAVRPVLAAAFVLLLGVVSPAPARAHANLDRALPAPGSDLDRAPARLQLSFSEAVDPSFSRVQLLDATGQPVDRGDSHVAPSNPRSMIVSVGSELSTGVYTVAWRTLSAVDGHTAIGAYPLIVGPLPAEAVAATTTTTTSRVAFAPETAIGRWWFSLTASVVFGTLLAWRVVFRPGFGRASVAALVAAGDRARRLALGAGLLLLVGTLYGAVAQAAAAGDTPLWGSVGRPLIELLSHGRYAALWWPRLALVLLVLGLVRWGGVRRWPGTVALGVTGLALLTSSLNSHGAALLSGAYLGVLADWLHFLGVAAWVGGLASLAYVLPSAIQASQAGGERVLAQAVARFSGLGLAAVALISVTGGFLAWLQVGSWDGLLQTAYGLSVIAKIALLGVTGTLAGLNLLILGPRLAALAGRRSIALSALARRFALSVRAELALLVLALVAAAVLTGLAPAREELARRAGGELQGGPVDRELTAQGVQARVQISPAILGPNRYSVELSGADPAQVERVQLTFTYLYAELGSQPLVLPPSSSSPRVWETSSALLSQAGEWQADLLVRRTGQDDALTAFRFLVTGPGGAPQSGVAVAGAYPLLPSPMVSLAYALTAAGLALGLGSGVRTVRRGGIRALQRQGLLVAAGVLVLVCAGLVYLQEQRTGVPLDVTNVRDPVPPDARSLASGRDVYETHCAACHGESGRGDGPIGLRLVPRPADLRIHSAPGVHADGELFYWVSFGYPGSAMPAWQDTLTEDQRWNVINYVRATFGTRT